MMDKKLLALVTRSANEANRRVFVLVATAVSVLLIFQVSIFGILLGSQQRLEAQNNILETQAEASEVQAELAQKQARQAKRFAQSAACATLEHRANSRSAERATLALIRNIIASTDNPEFQRIAADLRLPEPPEPRLINSYRRNCDGPGHFYDPNISQLFNSGGNRKQGSKGTDSGEPGKEEPKQGGGGGGDNSSPNPKPGPSPGPSSTPNNPILCIQGACVDDPS
jgi:hypothetical protein